VIHATSATAVVVFALLVAGTLALSFFLGARARSAHGFFAAGGNVHWFVNGIAFAGDYLSAASFLGICGMIAFYGYDGFLYSIGYLAGWVVALFVVGEPLRRMGRYTFADALDSRFGSRGIKLAAAASTLVVSLFYLIPQMVGAGALIRPLLGLPHALGVLLVGGAVVTIVVTAGMVSTTWVQFVKGALLVLFAGFLTLLILRRGLVVTADPAASAPQTLEVAADGRRLVDGVQQGRGPGEADLRPAGHVRAIPGGGTETGPLGPLAFLAAVRESEVLLVSARRESRPQGGTRTTLAPRPVSGAEVLRPGGSPTFRGIRGESLLPKLNFLSLMLALFAGTASLPHILIRYYTVKDPAAARRSTVVGIGAIGTFYVLTLYLGLGAMTSGAIDPTDSNMAAPLLARSFGEVLFAAISAIAFTTILGTVSGLVMAASGAVVHDLVGGLFRVRLTDSEKVRVGKVAAVAVGAVAMGLGVLFERMNVNFLVGWAFSVAASANLPSLVMVLVWKGTTKRGIAAAMVVGMASSLAWILASADTFRDVYGLPPEDALVPFSQPGIVTIPLGFLVLVGVSLLSRGSGTAGGPARTPATS
jgi:cation/acetate symporter